MRTRWFSRSQLRISPAKSTSAPPARQMRQRRLWTKAIAHMPHSEWGQQSRILVRQQADGSDWKAQVVGHSYRRVITEWRMLPGWQGCTGCSIRMAFSEKMTSRGGLWAIWEMSAFSWGECLISLQISCSTKLMGQSRLHSWYCCLVAGAETGRDSTLTSSSSSPSVSLTAASASSPSKQSSTSTNSLSSFRFRIRFRWDSSSTRVLTSLSSCMTRLAVALRTAPTRQNCCCSAGQYELGRYRSIVTPSIIPNTIPYNQHQLQSHHPMFGKISFGPSRPTPTPPKPTQDRSEPKQRQRKEQFKSKRIRKEEGKHSLAQKERDLQGAKFRLLNEMLYTQPSKEAVKYFRDNKEDFKLYHEGYRHQASKWTARPIDEIIHYILQNRQTYFKKTIVDLGCGEGFLHEELKGHGFSEQRIKSYDLVSVKPFIVEADIAKLPLKDASVEVCVFCLSLMGTNYLNFIRQARRVLVEGGELIISEVESRSSDWKKFNIMVALLGFTLANDGLQLLPHHPHPEQSKQQSKQKEPRFFRTMLFRKTNAPARTSIKIYGKQLDLNEFSTQILQSCTYKKR